MIHPIRLVWKKEENLRAVSIKSIIVASKKYLKLASDRNIVRRRISPVMNGTLAITKIFLDHFGL